MKNTSVFSNAYPMVSVCTPTFNRRPFIPIIIQCFKNQTWPRDRIEWIIVDDGTDPIEDVLRETDPKLWEQCIRYVRLADKVPLGKKRNIMHQHVRGDYVVYMDDDDYYPPERIAHAVESLIANPSYIIAGASEIYIYFGHLRTTTPIFKCGPYRENHATAATFAFRRELLAISRYADDACLAEERLFLQDYKLPMIQLDPLQTILVFAHSHNSFDKREMFLYPHPDLFRPAPPTHNSVDAFIRNPMKEASIRDFFLNTMENTLAAYSPGHPKYKPDVQAQKVIMDAENAKKREEFGPSPVSAIVVQEPNGNMRALTQEEVICIIQTQQQRIVELEGKLSVAEDAVKNAAMVNAGIVDKPVAVFHLKSKSEPEVVLIRK